MLNDDPLKINLLLSKKPLDGFSRQPGVEKRVAANTLTTNIPLFTDISFLIQKEIRELLHRRLPDYMVPSEFIALRQLPLTNNGKVDRLFLSQQEDRVFTNTLNYQPPGTHLEKAIAEIWKDLLHLDRVGIEDNFFDLGGHSLLAMRLIGAIRKKLEVELHIKELFVHPTIGLLAGHIEQLGKGLSLPPIEIINPRPEYIPLSFSQERLWFIDQLNGSIQYHIPAVLKLKGNLDIAALSGAFQQIINRHEVLRTVIGMGDGQGYQRVKEKDNWQLSVSDGTGYKDDQDGLLSFIKRLIETPFNLQEDYMLRATLVKLNDKEHLLVAVLHHIASDGWSTSIMVNELAGFYNLKRGN
jgi:acyl carrier protein